MDQSVPVTRYSLLSVFTALLLVVALAACGGNATAPAADDTAPAAEEPTAEEAAATDDAHTDEEDHAEDEEHAHTDEEDHAEDEKHAEDDAATDDAHAHAEDAARIDDLIAALQPIDEGDTLNVVATTNIVGDVVSQVGGDAINLTTLMPVGADPHSFEPTPQEVGTIAEADVVFVNGFDLEESLLPVIENSGIAPERIIPVSVGVETIEFGADEEHEHEHEGEEHHDEHEGEEHHDEHEGEEHHDETQGTTWLDLFADTASAEEGDDHDHDHDHSGADPHTWMSPHNVMVWADTIAATLAALDPANADTYTDNAASYTADLEALDAWIAEQIAQIPEANRELVTDHRAFGYYAHEYGLEQIGAVLPAYSTLAETSAQDLADLQTAIAELDVPAIFVGTTVNPDLAEQVAADTGVQLLPVYTGSLSDADGPAPTYNDMMRYNTEQFVAGLSG